MGNAKNLVIYGAGGLGREALTIVRACCSEWMFEGFIDDSFPAGNADQDILGDHHWLKNSQTSWNVIVAAGDPQIKKAMISNLRSIKNLSFPNLIHPDTTIGNTATIRWGKGCIVGAGVRMTTSITVGDYVLINLNATIGHDCVLGSFSSIMPGANISGQVTLSEGVLIGSGATILNGLILSDHCRVGAGAVVTKSIGPNKTVVGIPAHSLHDL